jgi:hypothetical protein
MYHGRGSGGRKQYKWEEHAAQAFKSFFGKRSGSPLPAAPPDAPLSEADHAASSSDEELPPPSPRVLSTTPVAWDANGRPTLSVRVEPRSPVPISGDEDYYEALLSEPLLSHEDVCDDSPPSSPQPAATTPLEPMPPSAPEEISGQTPLERKISDTRELVTLLVQTRAQGVTAQAGLAGCINWSSRDLSNFMTGKAPCLCLICERGPPANVGLESLHFGLKMAIFSSRGSAPHPAGGHKPPAVAQVSGIQSTCILSF